MRKGKSKSQAVVSYLLHKFSISWSECLIGSFSPEQSGQDDSTSSDDAEYIKPEKHDYELSDTKGPLPSLPAMAEQGATIQREINMDANRRFLGRMSAISQKSDSKNLDWALIHLDRQEALSSLGNFSRIGHVQSFVTSLPERARVQAITSSSGIIKGTIFGVPTFMQQPHSVAFQEMWTVRLEGPLRKSL
jgi:hypothetical protein